MKLADVLRAGATGWRDIHAALVPHNEPGDSTAGHLFEEFAKHFFLAAPEYKREFKNVWAEPEIPSRVRKKLTLAGRDHGVDLLLEDHEGRFHAVQCKFKTDQSKTLGWTTDRLSSWLAESDEAQGLVMFTNASGIDPQSTRKATKKDFTLVTVGDLLSLSPPTIRDILRLARGKTPKKPKRLKPRPYQRRAVSDVVKGFKTHDRGQLILPCGAGKTLTALWLKERLGSRRTLVLVPSLALLRQTRSEWATQQGQRLPYLCVCSEKDIDKDRRDAIVTHTFEVPGHVTTQPDEIAEFASKHDELVVYSTYQSLQAVIDAGVGFDLAICDEAHKTATARSKEFALVHEENLLAEKRLYMTATPRVMSLQVRGRLGVHAFQTVADMSDEDTFGPEFHRMGLAEAIDEGVLSDYKIVVVGVTDRQVQRHIQQRTYLEDASADQIATSLGLQKAMNKHNVTHAITFHSTVKRAKSFTEIHRRRIRRTKVEHVNGAMTTNDRLVLLDEFKTSPRAVMTNARCLTEGVDVPAIDCVTFVDPKHSKIDIVQAAGRALRRANGNKAYGVILIPLFYQVGEDPEVVASTGVFRNVFEVVRAMANHDSRLQAEITALCLGEAPRSASGARIEIDFGEERLVLEGFEQRLKKALVDRVVARIVDAWDIYFPDLVRFKEKHGHCDVPAGEGPLAHWVRNMRSYRGQGLLTEDRIRLLDRLGFIWNLNAYRWARRLEEFREWVRREENCDKSKMPVELGNWVTIQRIRRRQGKLSAEEISALQDAGMVWDPLDRVWQERLAELKGHVRRHGNFRVPQKNLSSWMGVQRVRRKRGVLSPERVAKLDDIGFPWERRLTAEEAVRIYSDPRPIGEIAESEGIPRLRVQNIKNGRTWTEATGTKPRPKRNRVTAKMALAIYRDPRPYKDLAKKHGVSVSTVGNIKTGRTWTDITGAREKPSRPRLSEEAVLAIYHDGRSTRQIAAEHGVSESAVLCIMNGITWSSVTGHKAGATK